MNKRLFCGLSLLTSTILSYGQQMLDTDEHSKYIHAVDEYVPAPGQFVNIMPEYVEGDTKSSMVSKCTEAIAGNKHGMIALGGYGGYVTFHFDHSIANIAGQYDFYISGNAIKGGAEPGIVMVSKDVNHNGIPDDAWYELSGSADVDSIGKCVYEYEITYQKDAMNDIPWVDNQGESGFVMRNSFHSQEYFPLWLDSPLKFSGTLLPKNGFNIGTQKQEYWVRNSFRYGYVDNIGNTDSLACSFDIDNAVDSARQHVELDFIDFVRVYTGVNQTCGWTGETSTEISGAEDLHLRASIDAIISSPTIVASFEDFPLDKEEYWNGSDKTGSQIDGGFGSIAYANNFISGSYRFNNTFNETWNSWSGFAVSNKTSVVFNDYSDQYNSAVGHGVHESHNYAVVFPYGETIDVLNKPEGVIVPGFYLTNTANNVKAYEEGDGITGEFRDGDWCKLTVTGIHLDGSTSEVEVYLADYRFPSISKKKYLDYWQWIDLSSLGLVKSISFKVTSSHNNEYGMTTPGYFCIDDFGGVPDETSDIDNENDFPIELKATEFYTLGGMRIASPSTPGVYLVKMSDGTVRKILYK